MKTKTTIKRRIQLLKDCRRFQKISRCWFQEEEEEKFVSNLFSTTTRKMEMERTRKMIQTKKEREIHLHQANHELFKNETTIHGLHNGSVQLTFAFPFSLLMWSKHK